MIMIVYTLSILVNGYSLVGYFDKALYYLEYFSNEYNVEGI